MQAGPRYAKVYQIHKTRCIFCGYCEEACPVSAHLHGQGLRAGRLQQGRLHLGQDGPAGAGELTASTIARLTSERWRSGDSAICAIWRALPRRDPTLADGQIADRKSRHRHARSRPRRRPRRLRGDGAGVGPGAGRGRLGLRRRRGERRRRVPGPVPRRSTGSRATTRTSTSSPAWRQGAVQPDLRLVPNGRRIDSADGRSTARRGLSGERVACRAAVGRAGRRPRRHVRAELVRHAGRRRCRRRRAGRQTRRRADLKPRNEPRRQAAPLRARRGGGVPRAAEASTSS